MLSTVFKVYERMLERKLKLITERTLMEPQSDFRKDRSTQDHIFTIEELITKTLHQGKRAYIAFIDVEKHSIESQKIKLG